ncbi:hypothetical protein TRAPUB_12333 [Trametes pubescens]|uniref:rRNA-processing protein FYV7 n=1 Tax=Trametes pubescens TaxID=154538 RepID=A0A1M2VUB2_TRAPU|nr:hypothetical protein TRAPUB_12333 [Trametes pubescens]
MPPQQEQPRGVKRKPPTFQHLPLDRAKKLKQSWVETQKIKSKWKAQKRKEGLVAPRAQLQHMLDAPVDKAGESDEEKDDDAASQSSSADRASKKGEEESEDSESEDEAAEELPSTSRPSTSRPTTSRPLTSRPLTTRPTIPKPRRRPGGAQEKPQEKPSLRELQDKAYSKESLHHHKSHPLKGHKAPTSSRGRGGGRGGNGRGAPRGRGGGQPDMGLRMKAMLEKIKQDLT